MSQVTSAETHEKTVIPPQVLLGILHFHLNFLSFLDLDPIARASLWFHGYCYFGFVKSFLFLSEEVWSDSASPQSGAPASLCLRQQRFIQPVSSAFQEATGLSGAGAPF